jgi:hypothetical protein
MVQTKAHKKKSLLLDICDWNLFMDYEIKKHKL